MSRSTTRLLMPLLATLLAAAGSGGASCGGSGGPPSRWQSLAGTVADDPESTSERELPALGALARRIVTHGSVARLEADFGREHWRGGEDGLWHVSLGYEPASRAGHALHAESVRYTLASPATLREGLRALPPDTFLVANAELWLRLAEGREPPARARLATQLSSPDPAPPGRLHGRRFSGAGFPLWPGRTVVRRCDFAAGSTLRFATTLEPLLVASSPDLPPLVFRVELDGEPLFEHHEPDPTQASSVWHAVPLPPGARRGATLAFSVEGPPGYTAILDPVLGPAEVGQRGARPWGASRPDVVVFLADTFRADNMQLYGGALALTPNLDRLAQAGLACTRSWSVGTFTLAGHASLFTALYPHQAGVLGEEHILPEELVTLAEVFASQGYRTGAITDAGMVARAFAVDQGFAYFDEKKRALEATFEAARAFLDADDGRPVLLFVHTYRVHRPFRVSDETRREHGARLGLEGTFRGLERELIALARAAGHEVDRAPDFPKAMIPQPEAQALIQKLRAHYQGGVIDLDRGFGEFWRDLEQRGVLAHGFLAFTSDHGEAFGEHGQLYHKDDVYEEQTRVPLVFVGRGLEPRIVTHATSSVDLMPTLVELAGLEGPFPDAQRWHGRSLLTLDEERVLYSFECGPEPSSSTFAVLDGGQKVIGLEDREALHAGQIVGAFDLTHDPRELRDAARDAAWPAEQLARSRPALENLLDPIYPLRAVQLDADQRRELDALGYGGGN